MPQTATIKSGTSRVSDVKAMQAEGVAWGEEYRAGARHGLAELLEGRMDLLIDAHLERMAELRQADRHNGSYPRWLLTELGMIELHVPRSRPFGALKSAGCHREEADAGSSLTAHPWLHLVASPIQR